MFFFHIVYNLHVMLDDIFFIINQHVWTSDCMYYLYAYYTVESGIKQLNNVQRLQNRAARILTGNFDYVNTR